MVSRDEDALGWDGDDDPTLEAAPGRRPAASERGTPAVPAREPEARTTIPGDGVVDADAEPLSNVTLVTLGVFGGIYLLLAVGWFIGASRLQLVAQLFVDPVAHNAAWILAVAAPAVWFVATLVLTRGAATWVRIVILVVGAVVLAPWPFLMTGVGA